MKKGEDRREQILETAQALFYAHGYEQTSVQDILDEMHLSKGGFYHHFESKMQVMEAICEKRAQEMRALVQEVIAAQPDVVSQLNALLDMCSLWHKESLDYTALMLRVAYRGDSAVLRERMRLVTQAYALDFMRAIVHRGVDEKVFYTRYPDDIGELILSLYLDCMDELARLLTRLPPEEALAAAAMRLPLYRDSVELLLNAPYGSVLLVDVDTLKGVLEALTARDENKTEA